MMGILKADPRAARQALLLIHLYASTDAQSLATLRKELLPLRYTTLQLSAGAGVATAAVAGAPPACNMMCLHDTHGGKTCALRTCPMRSCLAAQHSCHCSVIGSS